MKAILYHKLSNEQALIDVTEGRTIAQCLPDYNLDNAIVVVNGVLSDASHTVMQGDIITVRLLPTEPVTTMIVVGILAGVLAIGGGIAAGVSLYKSKKAAEESERALEKMKKASNKPDVDNRPFLRGATNTIATGNLLPYVAGRHLLTPYLACSPFYMLEGTDGQDQYTYMTLACGFNTQLLQSIAIEDIVIKTFTDTRAQNGVYHIDESVFAQDGRIEISQNGSAFADLTVCNDKVVSTTVNDEITKDSKVAAGTDEYLTFTLNPNAKTVDVAISFPYGLYAYNDNNDPIAHQVTITPAYSLDGGTTWTAFTFDNNGTATNTFNRNVQTKELRYRAHKEFTLADYDTLYAHDQSAIMVRLRSNGNTDSQIQNTCYCLYYQSVCFDPNKSAKSAGVLDDRSAGLVTCEVIEERERGYITMLALKLKASKLNEDKLKKVHIITQGMARTWNGVRWSLERTATRNAAAWALEILTSTCHFASRYADEEIDLESFGVFYDYCEREGFLFDYCITQNSKKEAALQYILDATGSALYYDLFGRLAVAIDKRCENALAVYNAQNIISVQNKKSFTRRTDGFRIKYVNSADDVFQEDTYLVMREQDGVPVPLTDDSIIKDLSITGVTTFGHVVKYARRMMALEALRPKTTTIEVGNEGVFYTPYSKILLQDDSLKIGLSSDVIQQVRYTNGVLSHIFIKGVVTFEAGKLYGVIVNAFDEYGAHPLSLQVAGQGESNCLEVHTVHTIDNRVQVEAGNVLSFGELSDTGSFERVTTAYLIASIKRSDKGFSLELVNYDEAIYESGAIPTYKSNITQKPAQVSATIPPDYVTGFDLAEAIANAQKGKYGDPDVPTSVQGIAEKDGIRMTCVHYGLGEKNTINGIFFTLTKTDGTQTELEASGREAFYSFDRLADGYLESDALITWTVSARVVNIYGNTSASSEAVPVDCSQYGTWLVGAPSVVNKSVGRQVIFELLLSPRADGKQVYGQVRYRIEINKPAQSYLPDGAGTEIVGRFDEEEFFRPATSIDPYTSEDHYKDPADASIVEVGDSYTQVVPLTGQNYRARYPQSTMYRYRVTASNEAHTGAAVLVDVCAVTTSAYDLSKDLAAADFTLGSISGDAIRANATNYWQLDDDPKGKYKKGELRAGGVDEYMKITPIVDPNTGLVVRYKVEFKAKTFYISDDAYVGGQIIIQEGDDALMRTRITNNGTFYEKRTYTTSPWLTIASSHIEGTMTSQLYSNDTLYITNQSIQGRRKDRLDIGNAYLSDHSQVYHFDTDEADQDQVHDLTIEGTRFLVGKETVQADIDFTPAILAVAPYSTIGRSLYGQYRVQRTCAPCTVFTVDFWLQYLYVESQVLFDIGNTGDRIQLLISPDEVFFEVGMEDVDALPFNEEIAMSRMYRAVEPVDRYNEAGSYFVHNAGFTGGYEQVFPDGEGFAQWIQEGLEERTIAFNASDGASALIEHLGQTQQEIVPVDAMGVQFVENEWVHIGILASEERVTVAIKDTCKVFDRYESAERELEIGLNTGQGSFVLDELFIDTTVCESFVDFCEHTENRIPWAFLDKVHRWTVLTAVDLEHFKTNIFDTTEFHDKVKQHAARIVAGDIMDIVIPVGFIYTQYPDSPSPQELWGSFGFTWEIVDYAGVFFRSEGGASVNVWRRCAG